MDRKMIYPGQIPLETDLLDTNRFALIGLGKLAAAVLGTSTLVNGLACTPTAPASMQVQVAPGEIYSLQNLDDTAYSSLAADTTHQVLKQGLLMGAATLSCPAPATNGQSINYLVQATYQDTDTNAVVLPYYNASNPTQAYSGPAGSGTAQNTIRKGGCAVNVKAGIAAPTGSQQTPAPDVGYVGLYSVTVAYGQTSITAGSISTASGAPFINSTLLGLSPAFTAIPNSPTPSQFDNSTKSATTQFVQRAIGNFQGIRNITTTPVSLTASDTGKFLSIYNSASVVNLPDSGTVVPGSAYPFYTARDVTLNSYGGQSIVPYPGSAGTVTSMVLPANSFGVAVWNGDAWEIELSGAGTSHAIPTASRVANTNYTNTTGKVMYICAEFITSSQATHVWITTPTGQMGDYKQAVDAGYGIRISAVVLPGQTYSWYYNTGLAVPTMKSWTETY